MSKNVDKFAILVAAIVVLGFIAFGLFAKDVGADKVGEINENSKRISDKMADARPPRPDAPTVDEAVRAQFTGAAPAGFTPWSFYRRPARLIKTSVIPESQPVHETPELTEVRPEQSSDLERPVIVVRGRRGLVKLAEIEEMTLETRDEGGEEWRKIATIDPARTEFELILTEDEGLKWGGKYSFRLRSRAVSKSKAPFAAGEDVKVSAQPSEPRTLPHAWGFKASTMQKFNFDETTGARVPGRALIRYERWDYGAAADDNPVKKKDYFDDGEPGKKVAELTALFGTKWVLWRIADDRKQNPDDKRPTMVTVLRHQETRDELLLWKNGEMPPLVPEEPWFPSEEPEETTAESGEETPEEPVAPKPDPETGTGGLFGDDDDDD